MVDDFRPYLTGVLHCGPPNPRHPRPTPIAPDPHPSSPTTIGDLLPHPSSPTHTRHPRPRSGTCYHTRRPRPTPIIPNPDRGPATTPVVLDSDRGPTTTPSSPAKTATHHLRLSGAGRNPGAGRGIARNRLHPRPSPNVILSEVEESKPFIHNPCLPRPTHHSPQPDHTPVIPDPPTPPDNPPFTTPNTRSNITISRFDKRCPCQPTLSDVTGDNSGQRRGKPHLVLKPVTTEKGRACFGRGRG